jgi:hypothetical protein
MIPVSTARHPAAVFANPDLYLDSKNRAIWGFQ